MLACDGHILYNINNSQKIFKEKYLYYMNFRFYAYSLYSSEITFHITLYNEKHIIGFDRLVLDTLKLKIPN